MGVLFFLALGVNLPCYGSGEDSGPDRVQPNMAENTLCLVGERKPSIEMWPATAAWTARGSSVSKQIPHRTAGAADNFNCRCH